MNDVGPAEHAEPVSVVDGTGMRDRVQPVPVELEGKGLVLFRDDDDLRVDLPRVGADRARAARDDHADVAFGAVVRLHGRVDRGEQFVAVTAGCQCRALRPR